LPIPVRRSLGPAFLTHQTPPPLALELEKLLPRESDKKSGDSYPSLWVKLRQPTVSAID